MKQRTIELVKNYEPLEDMHKQTMLTELSYYEFHEIVNNELFRRVFVIDLVKLDLKQVINLFDNFYGFQMQLSREFFFDESNRYYRNCKLLFICDAQLKEFIENSYSSAINNFDYFLKEIISIDEFNNLRDKQIILNYNRRLISASNQLIDMDRFNLIYGNNGVGKTALLNTISDVLKTPIFNMSMRSKDEIENSEIFKLYYKQLTSKDDIEKYTNIDYIYYNLCCALSHSSLDEKMVLLDDMHWGGMDYRNQINIVDRLNDFSYSNGVVVTSCQEGVKTLVKNRVYNHNIINL